MSETQDAQRPLSEKRVKEIAHYVDSENGILPNTLTLATHDNRIRVKNTEIDGIYYIDLPSYEEEYAQYKDALDVMDGQHRLYSFLPNIRQLHDDIKYEIGFTLYIIPTLADRRKIFVSCNEKQEKVSGNLLMWFKEKLDMLTSDERAFYNLVSNLNNDNPLRGRIIMGAEKIRGGIKAKEIMSVLKKAKFQDIAKGTTLISDEKKEKMICLYLSAWERVVGFSFANSSGKEAGAAVKIAGLRFMLSIFPAVWDRALFKNQYFDAPFVEETLKQMIAALNVPREAFFTDPMTRNNFVSETTTEIFANQCSNIIKSIGNNEDFDPSAKI